LIAAYRTFIDRILGAVRFCVSQDLLSAASFAQHQAFVPRGIRFTFGKTVAAAKKDLHGLQLQEMYACDKAMASMAPSNLNAIARQRHAQFYPFMTAMGTSFATFLAMPAL
jgi:hypothetical protein